MEIDVRDPKNKIKQIRYSTKGIITNINDCIEIINNGNCFQVRVDDIDNLILGLQKAKELWV